MRWLRPLVMSLIVGVAFAPAFAAEHGSDVALLVAERGLDAWDAMQQEGPDSAEHALLTDGSGRRNIAETNLNWAAALLETGQRTDVAHRVIEAVLAHQDVEEGSRTRGFFRWYADSAEPFSADATLYLAPALAHLARSEDAGDLRGTLRERAELALQGLLASEWPKGGFGAAMWAGAVAALADAVDRPTDAEESAAAVGDMLRRLHREGFGSIHSPTFDALRIGGLRWALQFASDDEAREQARAALEICYADMLQRYEPASGMIAGAIGVAYRADYLGDAGVAQYLLACDLPSALSRTGSASPLAMYFALSDYTLPAELAAMAERPGEGREVRTRTPADAESEAAEAMSTCTWVSEGMSLGTMSGQVDTSSIPIMATCDLSERPTAYFYPLGGTATLQSAQTGGLAICSFNFDRVGVGARINAGIQGMLGRRDQIDRVRIGGHDWIGEPEALGQGTVVALQRGSSFLGIRMLAVDGGGGRGSSVKPGAIEWLREGNMDSLMLRIYARRADYPLDKPVHDVRVGLLVEVAPTSQFAGLDEFADHVAKRRVSQSTTPERVRVDSEDERRQIPGRHEIKTGAEMRFLHLLNHEMTLDDAAVPLGLAEELVLNQLRSRTVPTALPEDYLWASHGLVLQRGGEALIGQAAAEKMAALAEAAAAAEAEADGGDAEAEEPAGGAEADGAAEATEQQ
ncbi:MAG: hypothetical protein ACOCX2_01230 [Armatimonadota bacterium]